MKSLFAPLLSVVMLALVTAGCEKAASPPPDEKVLFQAIEDNARAFNKKDVDGVMGTVHPKMPSFAQLRDFIAQTFSQVDLKVTVSDLKVVTSSPEEARVSFKQKTDKVTDKGVVPLNIVEGIHTLRPDNGTWKILATVNTKVTPLGEPPVEAAETTPSASAATPSPAATPAAAPEPPPAPEPAPKAAPPTEKPPQ
jgi:hypothetical protein